MIFLSGAGSGDDTIYGGSGDDTVWGDAGNDLLFVGGVSEDGGDNDTIYGGVGDDTLDLSGLKKADGTALSADAVAFGGGDNSAGTVTHADGTVTFSGIEYVTLGSGSDIITLGSGQRCG